MIKVEIISDSINPCENRITTWVLTYPRFIHSEVLTHRLFSRNSSSSRAIPVEKMLKNIAEEPVLPEFWGANQKGMQAAKAINQVEEMKKSWLHGRDNAIATARELSSNGLHKQLANRVVEPWMHITVLLTATEFHNFFVLRAHPDAQPEFQVLAYRMLHLYLNHKPVQKDWGDWHIPFGDHMPEGTTLQEQLKVACARAARVSYLTFEGEIDINKDIELHDRLMKSGHWSPMEHCAKAYNNLLSDHDTGNFKNWIPYRKHFPEENQSEVDLTQVLASKPDWISIEEGLPEQNKLYNPPS